MTDKQDFPKTRRSNGDIVSFSDFLNHTEAVAKLRKLIVELPQELLTEATRKNVGNFEARRDPPHFNGDEYHGHCEIPGGYEVSWGVSGKRRHPNKFPAVVPKDARAAVAKVLGVNDNLLEAFVSYDPDVNEYFLLLEYKTQV